MAKHKSIYTGEQIDDAIGKVFGFDADDDGAVDNAKTLDGHSHEDFAKSNHKHSAEEIPYDNSSSGLQAKDMQTAINEVIKLSAGASGSTLFSLDTTVVNVAFNADGSITETSSDNEQRVTTFNSDGTITEVTTLSSGIIITKKIPFNDDGSITEEII